MADSDDVEIVYWSRSSPQSHLFALHSIAFKYMCALMMYMLHVCPRSVRSLDFSCL